MQIPFVVFVLMQFIFTPIESTTIHHQHKTIQTFDSQEYGNDQKAGDACVKQLNKEYGFENVDPKTNSFGCIRVEHPGNPQPERHRQEGSGGMRS
jgi:hypothetical protein